jgi:hypothetical protein
VRPEIHGGAGPLETAAIIAAIARLVEEQSELASVPPTPPRPGLWVMSGRPRPISSPFTRPAPASAGWSVAADSNGEDAAE